MKRKKKLEKTRDDLLEKEINLQDVLDNYRQALENRTLYNTLKVIQLLNVPSGRFRP